MNHDDRCDLNNPAVLGRSVLHDFPVHCTCGASEAEKYERVSFVCHCRWHQRVSHIGAQCGVCLVLSTLAANLAIGGALCRAHANGGILQMIDGTLKPWSPGCQRPAP